MVWAGVDLLRFLLTREKPAAVEVLWAAASFTAVWTAAWAVREIAGWLARAREARGYARQTPATGQEVTQG